MRWGALGLLGIVMLCGLVSLFIFFTSGGDDTPPTEIPVIGEETEVVLDPTAQPTIEAAAPLPTLTPVFDVVASVTPAANNTGATGMTQQLPILVPTQQPGADFPANAPSGQGNVLVPQGGAVPQDGGAIPQGGVVPTQQPPVVYPQPTTVAPSFPVGTRARSSNCRTNPVQTYGGVAHGPYQVACHPINVTITGFTVVVDGVTRVQSNPQTDWSIQPNQTPWITGDGMARWTAQTPSNTQCVQWNSAFVMPTSTVQLLVDTTLGQDNYDVPVVEWAYTDYTVGICAFSADLTKVRAYFAQGPNMWMYAVGMPYDSATVERMFAANGWNGNWIAAYGREFSVSGYFALTTAGNTPVQYGYDVWFPKG